MHLCVCAFVRACVRACVRASVRACVRVRASSAMSVARHNGRAGNRLYWTSQSSAVIHG